MGCCLPKSLRNMRTTDRTVITMQENNEMVVGISGEDFDINRALVMFGQDKTQKNFMLSFDFQRKEFVRIKLQKKG